MTLNKQMTTLVCTQVMILGGIVGVRATLNGMVLRGYVLQEVKRYRRSEESGRIYSQNHCPSGKDCGKK